jgi:hypothetical protein
MQNQSIFIQLYLDGLNVNVTFSFQYSLKDNLTEVLNLFSKYGEVIAIYMLEIWNILSGELLEFEISENIKEVLLSTERKNLAIQIAKNIQEFTNTNLYVEKSKALVMTDVIKKNADMLFIKYADVRNYF